MPGPQLPLRELEPQNINFFPESPREKLSRPKQCVVDGILSFAVVIGLFGTIPEKLNEYIHNKALQDSFSLGKEDIAF